MRRLQGKKYGSALALAFLVCAQFVGAHAPQQNSQAESAYRQSAFFTNAMIVPEEKGQVIYNPIQDSRRFLTKQGLPLVDNQVSAATLPYQTPLLAGSEMTLLARDSHDRLASLEKGGYGIPTVMVFPQAHVQFTLPYEVTHVSRVPLVKDGSQYVIELEVPFISGKESEKNGKFYLASHRQRLALFFAEETYKRMHGGKGNAEDMTRWYGVDRKSLTPSQYSQLYQEQMPKGSHLLDGNVFTYADWHGDWGVAEMPQEHATSKVYAVDYDLYAPSHPERTYNFRVMHLYPGFLTQFMYSMSNVTIPSFHYVPSAQLLTRGRTIQLLDEYAVITYPASWHMETHYQPKSKEERWGGTEEYTLTKGSWEWQILGGFVNSRVQSDTTFRYLRKLVSEYMDMEAKDSYKTRKQFEGAFGYWKNHEFGYVLYGRDRGRQWPNSSYFVMYATITPSKEWVLSRVYYPWNPENRLVSPTTSPAFKEALALATSLQYQGVYVPQEADMT